MGRDELHAHLATGFGTVARAWAVTRTDGTVFGFTDHDRDLSFEGVTFKADTGLTAKALSQATGLSVDNTEAMGALNDAAIREEDIAAGRFDNAEVVAWLVNWADVAARRVMFRGHIGEVRRGAGAFHAELRGLSEALNLPVGRVYQRPCTAVLGDASCRFDRDTPGYFHVGALEGVEEARVFLCGDLAAFEPGWFQRGRLGMQNGDATGLSAMIKRDHLRPDGTRVIEVWEPLRAAPAVGDFVRLEAGCDKRFATCRLKFNNLLNFQGFPDVPEEDWMTVTPGTGEIRGRREPEMSVVVTAARGWIGTPYVHQASVRGAGCDCLGLLRGVWREVLGAEPERIPAYTRDWSEPQGDERLWRAGLRHLDAKALDEAAPGDVLLFRMRDGAVAKHIGVQAEVGGAPSFVHAYSGHGVIESALTAPWARRIVARFALPLETD